MVLTRARRQSGQVGDLRHTRGYNNWVSTDPKDRITFMKLLEACKYRLARAHRLGVKLELPAQPEESSGHTYQASVAIAIVVCVFNETCRMKSGMRSRSRSRWTGVVADVGRRWWCRGEW